MLTTIVNVVTNSKLRMARSRVDYLASELGKVGVRTNEIRQPDGGKTVEYVVGKEEVAVATLDWCGFMDMMWSGTRLTPAQRKFIGEHAAAYAEI